MGYVLTSFSQFSPEGSASSLGNDCFELTPATGSQGGAVWYDQSFFLDQYFDLEFQVFLGSDDNGADGIAFVIQTTNSGLGGLGGSLGYGGISPSIAVEYDTYPSDPPYDHIAVHKNGDISPSGVLAGPVQASSASIDIEDGQWHTTRINWDPSINTLNIYFDGAHRLTYTGDIINEIFGGNPEVYWGFTGATGGAVNLQQFCADRLYFGEKPVIPFSPWAIVVTIVLMISAVLFRHWKTY
jgi:hypothetical protein